MSGRWALVGVPCKLLLQESNMVTGNPHLPCTQIELSPDLKHLVPKPIETDFPSTGGRNERGNSRKHLLRSPRGMLEDKGPNNRVTHSKIGAENVWSSHPCVRHGSVEEVWASHSRRSSNGTVARSHTGRDEKREDENDYLLRQGSKQSSINTHSHSKRIIHLSQILAILLRLFGRLGNGRFRSLGELRRFRGGPPVGQSAWRWSLVAPNRIHLLPHDSDRLSGVPRQFLF